MQLDDACIQYNMSRGDADDQEPAIERLHDTILRLLENVVYELSSPLLVGMALHLYYFFVGIAVLLGKGRSATAGLLSPFSFIILLMLAADIYSFMMSVMCYRASNVILELDLIYRSKADLKYMYGSS